VDHDTSPTWSPDGKRVAFIRRPGTPFGLQAHQGAGSIGNPDGPAYNPLSAIRGRGARGEGGPSTSSGRAGQRGDAQRGADKQAALSADGRSLFYATNAADIERRHIWKVAIAGGAAEQLTRGDTIETYPAVLASGRQVAVLGGDAKRPFGVGLVPSSGGAATYIYPSLADFPIDAEVAPQLVMTKAADGMEIHNQLFLPKDLRPGEQRPAIVFVHG